MNAAEALVRCLDQAHRAVWVYGLVGARVDDARAEESFGSHRRDRDDLLAALDAQGVTPPAPPASYDLAVPRDRAQARALAQQVEADCAAAAADAVAVTTGRERRLALRLLQRAALGATTWDAEPQPFPGLDRPDAG